MDPVQPTPPPAQTPSQSVIPPPPADPIPDHSVHFTKYLWIFLAILVAITAIGSTFYLLNRNQTKPTPTVQTSPTPTPDPTANWKTYNDTKYGFSFKFPQNFSLHFYVQEGPYLSIGPDVDHPSKYDSQYITVEIATSYKADPNEQSEKIFIGNVEGLFIKHIGCPGGPDYCEKAIANVNGKSYIIELSEGQGLKGIPESLFLQILSTFKFTNP